MHKRIVAAVLAPLLILLSASAPVLSKGGYPGHDPWNPAYVDDLPQEIRASVARSAAACGPDFAAGEGFTRYIEDPRTGDRFIALHFDEVHCADRDAICIHDKCLHQVYVSSGGPYRRVLSIDAVQIELKLLGGYAAVQVTCASSPGECSKVLLWNGSKLLGAGTSA